MPLKPKSTASPLRLGSPTPSSATITTRSDPSGSRSYTPESSVQTPESPLSPANNTLIRSSVRCGDEDFDHRLDAEIENGKIIAAEIGTLLSTARSVDLQYNRDALNKLWEESRRSQVFESVETRTIAFLGNSGEGKSSLINSLLDCPDIAKTGDIGSACTSIVTEFRQKTSLHTDFIHLEADYLTQDGIEGLLKELLWMVRKPLLSEDNTADISATEFETLEKESEKAWSSLNGAFGHEHGFSRSFLEKKSEGAYNKILDQLVEWSYKVVWPEGSSDGKWCSTANDYEECGEKLRLFMTDRFWPFTKVIRVFLDSKILKTGLVIADLPGLHDTNLAHLSTTQTYLMRCDCIFIVANISRALSNASLKSSMYDAIQKLFPYEWEERSGQSFKLAVICTKSDEINVKANRREFCGTNKPVSQNTIDIITKGIEDAKKTGNKDKRKKFERQEKMLLRAARNEHVKRGLQGAYAAKLPHETLRVFCVSSKMYDKGTEQVRLDLVHGSEIPLLRRFCRTISAGAKLMDAKAFLGTQLSSLLASAAILAQDTTTLAERRPTVNEKKIKEESSKVTSEIMDSLFDVQPMLTDIFQESIFTFFDRRTDAWVAAAEKEAREWHAYHHTQYNAWCRNDGLHRTAGRSHTNWNAKLIWKMRTELEFQWELLDSEILDLTKDLQGRVKMSFKALRKYCKQVELPAEFNEALKLRNNAIDELLFRTQSTLTREISVIRHKTFEATGASYILREMCPAYRRASHESGPGYSARQKAIIGRHIPTVFPGIAQRIHKDLRAIKADVIKDLERKVEDVLASMFTDLELQLRKINQKQKVSTKHRLQREEAAKRISILKKKHTDIMQRLSTFDDEVR